MARFLDEGIIEEADLRQRLAYRYKVSDLKALLKERGLGLSGRKSELIERLVERDPKGMETVASDVAVYVCTSEGRAIAEAYKSQREELRVKVERQTLDALRAGELRKAIQLVASFDSQQVFPRGVSEERKHKTLEIVLHRKPQILASVSDQVLQDLRSAAAMALLWGSNRPENWLPPNLETGSDLDGATAARMMLFYAQQQVCLDEYRRSGVVKGVEVITAEDCCPSCQLLGQKVYSFQEVPVLPNPECTHPKGCRCTLAPVTKTYRELGIDIPETGSL